MNRRSYMRNSLFTESNALSQAEPAVCEAHLVNADSVARVARQMKSEEAVRLLAETFRVLGDATRIRIVFALMAEELCVCDLASLVGASQSAVSHSLRVLRQLNLVKFRKEGKIAYYRLDDEHIERLLEEGFRHVAEFV